MSTNTRIQLDGAQRAAINAPVADASNIIAGAGTGKTTVLVERYLKLVDEGIPIDRLLALTFTLKAAGEMRERVRRGVVERRPDLARFLSSAWILNFHQFGYRLIKENAPALGIDPGVDVVSLAEFQRIQRVLRARFEGGHIAGIPAAFGGEPPSPTRLGSLFDSLMKVVLHCRGIMLDPVELRAKVTDSDAPAYTARVDTVIALAREYETELQRRGLLDFSDMITIPARALRDAPGLAAAYRGAFDHILVDEFQDTSEAQNDLLRALSGGDFSRVTVVGDMKQSIYRWRDARVENILDFPDPDPLELARNYRSTQGILDLAHAFVLREDELRPAAVALEAERGSAGAPIVLFHPSGGSERHDDEAEALAVWIDHLLGRAPAPPSWGLEPLAMPLRAHEIAVLLRRLAASRLTPAIERVFRRRGIPFAIVGGANRAEGGALDSWHTFVSLVLPGDRAVELVAVLEAAPYRVSEASIVELFGGSAGVSALERLREEAIARVQDERDARAMRDARAGIEEATRAWRAMGFRDFLVWSIDASPLRARLLADGAQAVAVDELLLELLELADGLARRAELNLATFLDHTRAALDERKFREDSDVRLPADRVAVMTVHQAKGLEFPAVAVAGVIPGDSRSEGFLVSRKSGLYFGKSSAADWKRNMDLAENYERERHMEEVEERCVLYVALTRARDHLWVSSPSFEGRKHLKNEARPSLFTDVLECARELGSAIEVNELSVGAAVAPETPGRFAASTQEDVESALREWTEARSGAGGADDATPFADRHLVTATWQALDSFARCPLQFFFHRGGEPDDDGAERPAAARDSSIAIPDGVDPAAFGLLVHAALERVATGMGIADAVGAAVLQHDPGSKRGVAIDTARALVDAALAGGVAGPGETVRVEVPFAVRLNRLVVRGVIDRIEGGGEHAMITDYKVGERLDEHLFQVDVYAWAATAAGAASRVDGRVVYLRNGRVDVEDARKNAEPRVQAIADSLDQAITSGSFPATPGIVCGFCPHRSVCEFALR